MGRVCPAPTRRSSSSRSLPPTARAQGSASTSRASCAARTTPRSTTSTTAPARTSGSRCARYRMARTDRRAEGRGASVLVVDDEPDIRELLELTLVKMGLGVESVGTIAEAKDRLKGERYDLCLTD